MKFARGLLFFYLLAASGSLIAQTINTGTAQGMTKAKACESALTSAAAGPFRVYESAGRVEKVEKKCDCDQDLKQPGMKWSCLGPVSYVVKK